MTLTFSGQKYIGMILIRGKVKFWFVFVFPNMLYRVTKNFVCYTLWPPTNCLFEIYVKNLTLLQLCHNFMKVNEVIYSLAPISKEALALMVLKIPCIFYYLKGA